MDAIFCKEKKNGKTPSALELVRHCERNNPRLDVDWSRTKLNKEFGDIDVLAKINEYKEESQQRTGKKLDKRTTLIVDWCVHCPPEIEGQQDKMDYFFEKCVEYTQMRYEKYGFVVKGYVHYDEIDAFHRDNGNKEASLKRSHIHIMVIPYGDYIDDKRKNLNHKDYGTRYRREDTAKRGFCAGFVFPKRELSDYQDKLKDFVKNYFKENLTFGEMNEYEHSKLVKYRQQSLKAKEMIKQYEDIITTQKELFEIKYKDNEEVIADYNTALYDAVQKVGEKSSTKSLFSKVKSFFINLFNFSKKSVDQKEQGRLVQLISDRKSNNQLVK